MDDTRHPKIQNQGEGHSQDLMDRKLVVTRCGGAEEYTQLSKDRSRSPSFLRRDASFEVIKFIGGLFPFP